MSDDKDIMKELVRKIESAFAEAENFADENDLGFNIYPTYGMGGYYDGEEGQWYPSSESC